MEGLEGMNVTNVATFLEIARTGSFREASRRLNVGQSTVSARVAALEAHLGVALFDRTRRRVALSEAGRRFLEPAREVVSALGRAEMAVSDDAALARTLRIGAVEVIAISWLARLVGEIAGRYPSVLLDVTVQPTVRLLSMLGVDELDVLLVPEPGPIGPGRVGERRSVDLGSVEWAAATGRAEDAVSGPWSPGRLAERRLATLGRGSLIAPALDAWFRGGGARPSRPIVCDSVSLLVSIARSGTAVGLLPRSLEAAADGVAFQPLQPALPRFRYVALVGDPSDRLAVEVARMACKCSTFVRD